MAEEATKKRATRARTVSTARTSAAKETATKTKASTTRTTTKKATSAGKSKAAEAKSVRTTKATTARTKSTKAAEVQLSSETVEAVAASLAALKKDAPARRTRTRVAAASNDVLDSIAESAADARDTKKKPAATQRTRARTTKKKANDSGLNAQEAPAPQGASVAPSAIDPFSAKAETVTVPMLPPAAPMTALLFQEPDADSVKVRRRRAATQNVDTEQEPTEKAPTASTPTDEAAEETTTRRRRRGSRGRRKAGEAEAEAKAQPKETDTASAGEAPKEVEAGEVSTEATTTVRKRTRKRERTVEPVTLEGSTRLEAKRQRRKEGREAGRRRHVITESEYLARRESVNRQMLIREQDGLNQIAVLEDDILVEHYVARHTQVSMVGNVYLGRVQNVLPSMEAAFVDIGKGRNAVLYAGEVNWEAAGMEGKPRKIEHVLKSGDTVLVQVTKDPIGHKGARLTAQITLAGRHLVLVPSGAMTGISRKLPEKERTRLKKVLRQIVPPEHGVIVRTAAEGASEDQLKADVERLTKTWDEIQDKASKAKSAPVLLKGEPELAVRVVRDIFNEDFAGLHIQGDGAYGTIREYVAELSPELEARVEKWTSAEDIFSVHRVDEQLAKAFDRKVWLPSGGTLVIDRTEAMTVIDVNTGKFTGSGGTLEETVTKNNLEAAEEIVRQLRLRDIGGIIVVDFIDMVLESNRELVLRRLVECLGRDRTRHQVAEVTSLGLVQMTRKRVGQGLVEAFSTTCSACEGRGYLTHSAPVEHSGSNDGDKKHTQVRKEPKQKVQTIKDDPKTKSAMQAIAAASRASKAAKENAETSEASAPATTADNAATSSAPASSPEPATAPKAAPATRKVTTKTKEEAKPVRRTHAATSSGTVVPTSAASAILSFPVEK